VDIDYLQILSDLNEWGWSDYKIEIACGLPKSSVYALRNGGRKRLDYQNSARLFNFWEDEQQARAANSRQLAQTTT
jgi:hypothetical protein